MEAIREYTIYTLNHPVTNLIYYVGLTHRRLKKRLWAHVSHKLATEKYKWIRELKEKGMTPVIKKLFIIEGTRKDALNKEKEFTEIFCQIGHPLFNKLNAGYKMPFDIKDKISHTLKEIIKNSPERQQKLKDSSKKGWLKRARPILQYNKDGNFVKRYETAASANKDGFESRHIAACAKGRRKHHKGFIWKYA